MTNILSWIIFMPMIGAALIALVPRNQLLTQRAVAMIAALVTFALTIVLYMAFDGQTTGYQFVENTPWIRDFGIAYFLGIDGISLWMVMLTALVSLLAVGFSFTVQVRVKEFMIFTLLLETAILGVFCALDLVLFYIFFELTLVPMYFLIAIWGGHRRANAALKFFLYTFLGSIFMLLAMLYLGFTYYRETGAMSFSLLELQAFTAAGGVASHIQQWLFVAFALAFAIKLPLFPFHTWMPDAQGEAPIAANLIFLKIGAYAFMRFAIPMFPEQAQAYAPLAMGLAAASIIYAAIVAVVQTDIKRLVVYASISHAGFAILGLFAFNTIGWTGSVMQQLSHGISTGALFLLLGMLYTRRNSFQVRDFGGLKREMPIFTTLFFIALLASVGLPGTNGFIGEFLCLMGAYKTNHDGLFGTGPIYAILSATGVILAAVYMLWMFQRVFYGPPAEEKPKLNDLRPWEIALTLPLIILIFVLGLQPGLVTQKTETAVDALLQNSARVAQQSPATGTVEE